MTDDDISNVTLALLAGGEGRRMGTPKSRLRARGQSIIAYLMDNFRWPGATLLVTAPGLEHPPGGERLDGEATDRVAGRGPLQGVLTALENARTPVVIVATVDMPGIGHDQLRWLAARVTERPEIHGMMTRRMDGDGPQIEPFPFVCRAAAAGIISKRLADGNGSVHSLLDVPGFVAEPAPADWPGRVWANLNMPGEWDEFFGEV